MTRNRFSRLWLTVAALGAALPASSLTAPAARADEGLTPKQVVCRLVGCSKGTQKCADVTGSVEFPEVGKLAVTYVCYEPGAGELEYSEGEGGGDIGAM